METDWTPRERTFLKAKESPLRNTIKTSITSSYIPKYARHLVAVIHAAALHILKNPAPLATVERAVACAQQLRETRRGSFLVSRRKN